MSRHHGRNARLYVGIASDTAEAEPLAYCSKWRFDIVTESVEMTANGDTNKVYVSRRPEISGAFNGFVDVDSAQTYTAACDGLARRFYLYPTTPNPGVYSYFYGTAVFDFKADAAVDGPVAVQGGWWAQTFTYHGADGSFSDAFSPDFDGGFGL